MQLNNPELDARLAVAEATLQELQQRRAGLLLSDELGRQILQSAIGVAQAEVAELKQQQQALRIINPVAGVFQAAQPGEAEGRYVAQGEVLGYVFKPQGVTLTAVVSQATLPRLQSESHVEPAQFSVRFRAAPETAYPAHLVQEIPAASRQLPGALLGSAAGGEVRIDARDQSGRTAEEAVYQLRFSVPDYPFALLAARAVVRAEHAPVSLLSRLLDMGQRLWWQHQARSD